MEMEKKPSPEVLERIHRYQREEVTGHILYGILAKREKNPENRALLERFSRDEETHAEIWGRYSGRKAPPKRLKIWFYSFVGFFLGFTFVLKLMEKDEALTVGDYSRLVADIPEMKEVIRQEEEHEGKLQSLMDEERLRYVGSMVLGLNDALVELTGTLAGLTFALQDNRLVALAGIITGASATLSMAASNYLAERADDKADAFKSSLYTGIAYLVTVVCLVLPYLLLPRHMYGGALAVMLAVVILIILFFNYYVSVAKSLPFWRRFGEMAGISLGVAVISFGIGLLAKYFLHLEV